MRIAILTVLLASPAFAGQPTPPPVQQGGTPAQQQGGTPAQQNDDTVTGDGDLAQAPVVANCQVNALTFANVAFNQAQAAQNECNSLLQLLNSGNAQCQVVNGNGGRKVARLRFLNQINAQNIADAVGQLTNLVNNGHLLANRVLGLQITNNGACQ